MMQLVSIPDFDSGYPCSSQGIVTNGVFGLTVKSFACEAKNVSSILTLHPKCECGFIENGTSWRFRPVSFGGSSPLTRTIIPYSLTDKTIDYESINLCSNRSRETFCFFY
jgi:hypothetical protein